MVEYLEDEDYMCFETALMILTKALTKSKWTALEKLI